MRAIYGTYRISSWMFCEFSAITAYHPQSNGLSEQKLRIIKASLKSHVQQNKSWVEAFPFVLLELRDTLKEDIRYSSAGLLYGSPLCLLGEFVTKISNVLHSDSVQRLQNI
ncbi:hypothetical protein CEXT_632281 [Caerostris extrusa]|uniref:Integrase catalytic domain-containing protein n=1 Tax=Caerostris extrusa TaxID=172846 RepID=A0AAV4UY55_CAEEX|nr:hypothetical protein CEXT_632281 [Caerostris extrusa]